MLSRTTILQGWAELLTGKDLVGLSVRRRQMGNSSLDDAITTCKRSTTNSNEEKGIIFMDRHQMIVGAACAVDGKMNHALHEHNYANTLIV